MVTYSTAHRALVDVGRAYNVPPTDMRLLVRLAECGGQAYTDEPITVPAPTAPVADTAPASSSPTPAVRSSSRSTVPCPNTR